MMGGLALGFSRFANWLCTVSPKNTSSIQLQNTYRKRGISTWEKMRNEKPKVNGMDLPVP